MKVRIQFFSHLKDAVGAAQLEQEIPEGTSVRQLLELFYLRYPRLSDWDANILIGVGVEFVGRAYVLQANDEVALMPPLQGG